MILYGCVNKHVTAKPLEGKCPRCGAPVGVCPSQVDGRAFDPYQEGYIDA